MKIFAKFVAIVIGLLTMVGIASVDAKNKNVTQKVYIYGFSASFNDSIIYITDIQELDSVPINNKNKFLINREEYSAQLNTYFENQGQQHRTCIVSYALKLKDAQKKFNKLRNKYVKRGGVELKYITKEEFKFTAVRPYDE